jgi:hypothetical protein
MPNAPEISAEQLLNNKLQNEGVWVFGTTEMIVTQSKQTKIGRWRTGQGELADRRRCISSLCDYRG